MYSDDADGVPEDLEFLKDPKLVDIVNSNYANKRTAAGYVAVIVAITKRMGKKDPESKEVYEKVGEQNNAEWRRIQEKDQDNELSCAQARAYTPWDELISARDSPEKMSGLNINEKMIVYLYTMVPPRRCEYRNMKLGKGSDDENYMFGNKFYFGDYKTVRSSGIDIVDIPKDLQEKIDKYLDVSERKEGEYLLGTNRTSSCFSSHVKNAMNKLTGVPITVTSLRRMYSTKSLNNEKLTYNEKNKVARAMGTSVDKMEKVYNKVGSTRYRKYKVVDADKEQGCDDSPEWVSELKKQLNVKNEAGQTVLEV